jgi:hypothetical protein
MPSSNKIQVYLPVEVLEKLKSMSAAQRRSASNLAAALIIETLETPGCKEAIAMLKGLANGDYPSDADIILTAHELDIEPEKLFNLRDRLTSKGKQPNGK